MLDRPRAVAIRLRVNVRETAVTVDTRTSPLDAAITTRLGRTRLPRGGPAFPSLGLVTPVPEQALDDRFAPSGPLQPARGADARGRPAASRPAFAVETGTLVLSRTALVSRTGGSPNTDRSPPPAVPDELSATNVAPLVCAGVTTYSALRRTGRRGGADQARRRADNFGDGQRREGHE